MADLLRRNERLLDFFRYSPAYLLFSLLMAFIRIHFDLEILTRCLAVAFSAPPLSASFERCVCACALLYYRMARALPLIPFKVLLIVERICAARTTFARRQL